MSKRILVAPLDWGLGHTTRCIPIIEYLSALGHQVIFAGNERQLSYMSASSKKLQLIHLEGYDVRYARSKAGFMVGIFKQIPRLVNKIKEERAWLERAIKEYNIDVVISDNRYGLYNEQCHSIIMTHQLQPISGLGRIVDDMVRKTHYKYLSKFDACWVVDTKERKGLAGKMSQPKRVPNHVKYIGWLSQLASIDASDNHIAIVLSGPEPQRTLLSNKLWDQATKLTEKVVFVEGSEKAIDKYDIPDHITYYKRLTKEELGKVMRGASVVICRSGYSTIMDLVKLEKKAVLIPTPGQTEQEYLAKTLNKAGIFMAAKQRTLSLSKLLNEAKQFPFRNMSGGDDFVSYKAVLDKL